MFEQFTQLNTSNTESRKGLGLGLNITRSLAEILGYDLDLISAVDKGCNFSISVPETLPNVAKPAPVATSQMNLQGVTVLCVDNDPDVLNGMVELLTIWQCDVISAASTVEAKEKFGQRLDEIEILLVDYQLENDNTGIMLTEQIRQMRSRYVPAILITATTEVGIEQKAADADLGFMRKLVKPAALRAMMNAKLAEGLRKQYIG